MKKPSNFVFLIAFLIALFLSPMVAAETKTASSGLTISPFLQEATITENEQAKDLKVSITNNTAKTQNLKLSVIDFGSLNETGGIVFAGSNSSSLIKKYGLATWMKLATDNVLIQPGKSSEIKLSIDNTTSMQPGGHYAAVVATASSPDNLKGSQVHVSQSISSLVLITKVGGEKYDISLKNIEVQKNTYGLPTKVSLDFNNPGNVHIVPRGTVELVSPSGKVISGGVINEASTFVLPELTRKINVEMHKVSNLNLLPATYKLKVNYRYDGIDKYATKTLNMRIINYTPIFILIIFLGAVITLVFLIKTKKLKLNLPKLNRL